jgi:YVTN family beta-propeller protein
MTLRGIMWWTWWALLPLGCGGNEGPHSVAVPAIEHDALYVLGASDRSIAVLDLSRGEIASTIRLRNVGAPRHLDLAPDRSRLLVTVPEDGRHGGVLLLLDARTGSTIQARRFERPLTNALFLPEGHEIWIAQAGAPGAVRVVDLMLADKERIPVGAEPAAIRFGGDGRFLFVTNRGSDDVSVIEAATRSVVRTLAVGRSPAGIWSSPGGRVYVESEGTSTLASINGDTLALDWTYPLGFRVGAAAPGPEGELWVADAEGRRLLVFRDDLDGPAGEIATPGGVRGIAFTPDGTTAFVSSASLYGISVLSTAFRTVWRDIPLGVSPAGLAIRPR